MVIDTIATGLRRVGRSTVGFLIVFLLLFDLFIVQVRPLRYANATNLTGLNQNPVVSKLPEFLRSKRNPEILMVGTSLVLVPSVRLDDELSGKKTRYDRWYYRNHILEYDRADYLKKQLSDLAARPLDLANLGIVGSMMSDHYLIVKKSLSAGKRPRLIICAIAPRDFLDNYRGVVEKTPTYQAVADFTSIGDLLKTSPSLDTIADITLASLWSYYKTRNDYQTFVAVFASRLSGHPLNLYMATTNVTDGQHTGGQATSAATLPDGHGADDGTVVSVLENVEPVYTATRNQLGDLELYKRVYLPVNSKLYETQMSYLEKLLKLAQRESVFLVLIDMPLTKDNLSILPANVLQRYRRQVAGLCSQYTAKLVRPGQEAEYTLSDFEDSCHLNGQGGKKFCSSLVKAMASDRRLLASVTRRQSLITTQDSKLLPFF